LVRVLLVSTYDLGRQPFGLASPAAWLRRDGHDVTCVDTSRTDLADAEIASAELVAFYLPMHTATRLAEPLVARCRATNPRARLAAYGLYAPLNDQWLRDRGVSDVLGPEAEQDLVDLANGPLAAHAAPADHDSQLTQHTSRIARLAFIRPQREGLPALTQYASLHMADGTRRIVGSTDATRGCKHLCRHCPIVPVYNGTFRVIPMEIVLQDIAAQVEAGAQHISFGDPDFFNGPTHARRIVERLARDFPQLTYDVTIKIEHLLMHRDLLPLLASTGCLFVTSAVESVDDEVLARLAKGHTRAGFEEAVGVCREVGVRLSPTFVAFTPWTTLDGYLDLLQTIARLGLVEDVAPIQLAIRLLVTAGSRLLELPDLHEVLSPFDGGSLTYPWTHRDPAVDHLQREIMSLVGAGTGGTRRDAFATIWNVAHARAGQSPPPLDTAAGEPAPYTSEPWYCCAEPAEFKL
jgi:radical SAM superfamily enzyme YgiQ (UPF0313 family)